MAVERTLSIINPDGVAKSVDENAVHGSDGPGTAKVEIAFLFKDNEICPRTRQQLK